MGAHQAPPSLGISRQEHWSGLPFPSPMRESEVAQSCLTLSDPMDCSPPGSSVPGIFQARVLEWGASVPNPRALKNYALSSLPVLNKKTKTKTTKPGCQHICSQHSLLNILSPWLRPTAQKKGSFQDVTTHWPCTWWPESPDGDKQWDSRCFHACWYIHSAAQASGSLWLSSLMS